MYRLDELGSLQFERLSALVAELELGVPAGAWQRQEDGLLVGAAPSRRVVVAWKGRGLDATERLAAAAPGPPTVVVTNLAITGDVGRCEVVGAGALTAILDRRPDLRLRVPSVLGVRALAELVADETAGRSSADLAGAHEVVRVFVPTRAYSSAVEVLQRHRFCVLTGPPEMGKTAIARSVALALASDGWEAHECLRPDELWARYAHERRQVFVADDAFGSTEYRADAAERWALELDRVLHALDERHLLLWTSRPAPLRAALARIHREHGVERWPRPAEVQVAASALDVEEKALILFRHARAAELPAWAVEIVRAHGWQIVAHPHFTPERIRRFVSTRLLRLEDRPDVAEAIAAEIREPTRAMAASFRALAPEHRALLVALLDAPPGPVPERVLAAAARRHVPAGLPRAPAELVDRLADHFLHGVPPASVTWVHPSWRDLVIDELACDAAARQAFLERCSLEGALLALSVAGGAAGERTLPLLRADGNWDALADRVAALVPDLDGPGLFRLLTSLADTAHAAHADEVLAELASLAHTALELVRRRWDEAAAPLPVSHLAAWLALARVVPDAPPPPKLGSTWVELAPTSRVDVRSLPELARLDEWASLVAVLEEHAPAELERLGYPAVQAEVLVDLRRDASALAVETGRGEARSLLARVLARLRLGEGLAARLVPVGERLEPRPTPRPRGAEPGDRALVARILADL